MTVSSFETVIAMFLQTLRRCLYPLVLIGSVVLMAAAPAFGVVLWDTGSALTEGPSPAQRGAWRAVPSELFVFETDPLKAASDPGYYGRDYSFKGDAVVETEHLALVISPTSNRVLLYSKTHPLPPDGSAGEAGTLGAVIAEIAPVVGNAEAGRIRRVEVLSNIGDEVMLEVGYGVAGSPEVALDFSCGRDAIVAVRPRATVSRIRVRSPIEYGVIPAFIGDDLVLGPDDFGPGGDLCPPVEKAFLGLLRGEDCELLLTLPGDSSQPLVLRTAGRNGDGNDPRTLELEISGDGGFYLGAVTAPGVWHREPLAAAFLEKDVAIEWKPPFAARWKTQLIEAGLLTTFHFREEKGQIWRGVAGSYQYPVWFQDGAACYHLSKKVPPKGESLVYFLEGHDTPHSVLTPVDFLRATLGRSVADAMLDFPGRKLRTHHRRGAAGVHRACTCGCTEAIQAIFETREEVAKQEEVRGALEDMNFFVQRHVERIEQYQQFASDLIRVLQSTAGSEPLRMYCERLDAIAQQIPEECRVQRDNMKSLDHAADLTRRTLALTAQPSPDNLQAYMKLLDEWRAMGGAQDYVLARCHVIVRQLFQEAGSASIRDPRAGDMARSVRARCREVLRHPDGYEIWDNY